MKQLMTLFAILSLACTTMLAFCGDFTPYFGEPDTDAFVILPSFGEQLGWSFLIGSAFAIVVTLALALWRSFWPCGDWPVLLLVSFIGFASVVYFYADFKTYLGVGKSREVFYELPWGISRGLISAVCGLVLGGLSTGLAVLGWQALDIRQRETEIRPLEANSRLRPSGLSAPRTSQE